MSERRLRERVETIRGHRYIRLKSGRLVTFWDVIDAAKSAETDLARAVSRAFKLVGDGYDLELLTWQVEGLEEYVAAIRAHLNERLGDRSTRERIVLLRNTTGRTPEEAEAFRAKADQLEAALSGGPR